MDDERRRERYRRRGRSAGWLVAAVREAVGLPADGGGLHAGDEGWVRPPRPARCSWRTDSYAYLHGAPGTRASYSGVEVCGSVWACPVCASVVRPQRAREIERAVTAHQRAGGSGVFVTLTLRHHASQPLAETLDTALKGWQRLLAGAPWLKQKKRYAVEGYIRAVEVTDGASGWHPHIHALILTGRELSAAEAEALGDWIYGRWSSYAERRTGRRPSRRRGVDVQRLDAEGRVLARYLGKVQDEGKRWGVGAELARGDVKTGRGRSRVPFELLDSADPRDRRRWVEFVTATKGRRALTWSRGLKARFGIEDESDEATAEREAQQAAAREVAYQAPGRAYDALRRSMPVMLALALEAVERGDLDAVEALLPGGRRGPLAPPLMEPPADGGESAGFFEAIDAHRAAKRAESPPPPSGPGWVQKELFSPE